MVIQSLTQDVRWSFCDASVEIWRDAVVPGCVHRDLLRLGLIPDPFFGCNEHEVQWVGDRDWIYRGEFEVADAVLQEAVVELVAEGLDTLATVAVNGHEVWRGDNMFVGMRVNVTEHLRPGSNVLAVRFDSATQHLAEVRRSHRPREINDPVGGGTKIRKQQCQFGWDWAPRLVTAGIWRDLRLESWSSNRIVDVRVTQRHGGQGVSLKFVSELARPSSTVEWRGTVSLKEEVVAEVANERAQIVCPLLWWPGGQGAQPLYEVRLELWEQGRHLDTWSRRIGLRTVELERKPDQWGESFQFVVNGRPVFAKGASWIPAHSFVGGLSRADYEPLLRSAVAANMNMLRVWGGGIYEHECFYDLCDELGLLVWQDFMFACTLYPGDAAFRRSVKQEATYQVRRLRHRACLALWCGNNELELLNEADLAQPKQAKAYDAIFRGILPTVVQRHDGVTPYWRSSPSDASGKPDPERSGNTHFWDVWHLRKPVKDYELRAFRFVSEFGMQSFPSGETARTFCPPEQLNVFSPVMENHQKNPIGNQVILDYISRRYRFPKDYESLAYLSQLNQAHCIQVGVEHYRRNRPRSMGTLYWQFNDCWPVASWSSLEFGGAWKALHWAARRFYAPLLVSVQVRGDETVGIGNRLRSTVSEVTLHTINDLPDEFDGELGWEVWHASEGRVLDAGRETVRLRALDATRQTVLDLAEPIARHGRDQLILRVALKVQGREVSEQTVFLTPPRCLELARVAPTVRCAARTAESWNITFVSPVFQHGCRFALEDVDCLEVSDNWFDLYPGREKKVTVTLAQSIEQEEMERAVRFRSLVESYV